MSRNLAIGGTLLRSVSRPPVSYTERALRYPALGYHLLSADWKSLRPGNSVPRPPDIRGMTLLLQPHEVARDILTVAAFCRAAHRRSTADRLVAIAADLLVESEPRPRSRQSITARIRRWFAECLCSLRRRHDWGPGRRGARMIWLCYRCETTSDEPMRAWPGRNK